jgi:predicted SAM-dependent methyltransferase
MPNKIKTLLKSSKPILCLYYGLYAFWRKKYLNRERRIYKQNKKLFKNKSGIEIGGPSPVFTKAGPVPFYEIISHLDNINHSDKTVWSSIDKGENFEYNKAKQKGKQIIADATDLTAIASNSYDFMLSSHVIEHVANPIKALNEWKRIIKSEGYLTILVPNRKQTFDRKRPLTQLNHIIDDYKNHTKEDDSTHFEEIIKLHDVPIDGNVTSYEDHVNRTLNNKNIRVAHHHTFDINLLIELLKYCDFEIIDSQIFQPYHLMVIAQKHN